jgi:hypothetical protein
MGGGALAVVEVAPRRARRGRGARRTAGRSRSPAPGPRAPWCSRTRGVRSSPAGYRAPAAAWQRAPAVRARAGRGTGTGETPAARWLRAPATPRPRGPRRGCTLPGHVGEDPPARPGPSGGLLDLRGQHREARGAAPLAGLLEQQDRDVFRGDDGGHGAGRRRGSSMAPGSVPEGGAGRGPTCQSPVRHPQPGALATQARCRRPRPSGTVALGGRSVACPSFHSH